MIDTRCFICFTKSTNVYLLPFDEEAIHKELGYRIDCTHILPFSYKLFCYNCMCIFLDNKVHKINYIKLHKREINGKW